MDGGCRGWRGCGTGRRGCRKRGERKIPHGDLQAANEVATDAGGTAALWEATEKGSIDGPDVGDDVDCAIGEVLRRHFDVAFRRATRNEHGAALVFKGDAIKVFFFVV